MMDLAFNFEEEKTMPAEAAAEGPQPKTVTELSNEIKRLLKEILAGCWCVVKFSEPNVPIRGIGICR